HQNNPRSALVLATESELRCYNLTAPGELLWRLSYNSLGLPENDRIHLFYNPLEDPQLRERRLIFASTNGSVGSLSLDSLQAPILYHQEGEISILSFLPAVRNIFPPLATIALNSGRIESFPVDQRALQPLWVFQRAHSQPIQLLPFADVDHGGAIDLLALYNDGWAGVISSGGDLHVHPLKSFLPRNDFSAHIYPQPFNSQSILYLNISPGIDGPLTVQLYDLSGRVLRKEFVPISQGRIILPNLFPSNAPTGLYFISFQSQDGGRWCLSGTLIR
ncbi:MAG: T9SS type A sorting domain-containing protein, partial [bacterium]